jgi:hypothetical protein
MVSDPHEGGYTDKYDYWTSSTDQIIVTRNTALLAAGAIRAAAQPLVPRPDFPVWSDNFYNLLRVLKY